MKSLPALALSIKSAAAGAATRLRGWKPLPFAAAGAALVLCGVAVGALLITRSVDAPPPDDRFVAAVTGGVIAPNERVRVVFVNAQDTSRLPPARAVAFSPAVRGDLSWQDDWTLIFTPAAAFKSETRYKVLITPALFPAVDEEETPAPFMFEFSTRGPLFEVFIDDVHLTDNKMAEVRGRILTGDDAKDALVEKSLYSPNAKIASWRHEKDRHFFTFEPVERGRAEKDFTLKWDAKAVGSKRTGSRTAEIPILERFEVSNIAQSENSTIKIEFSSPLKNDADLRGFIEMEGAKLSYKIEDNIVDVYSAAPFKAGAELSIRELSDRYGETLAEAVTYTVSEKWELPEARFTGEGVILPTTQGTVFPLETRNLSGVIIEAFEIYGDNIVQFLQENKLHGETELFRVGAPAWTRAFDFEWSESEKNRWVRRGLDLSALARRYPDAMFHLRVTFRKRHVHYECPRNHADFSNLQFPSDAMSPINDRGGEFSAWNTAGGRRDWDYAWYQQRDDPCHPAFYMQEYRTNITIGRNILVSDLGILAKRAESGEYLVAATNLRTARGFGGVEIQFLNFQGRALATATTAADGTARLRLGAESAPAAFIFARGGGQRAFLKLNDSFSLATSHFDVSGEKAAAGLKGFIYGERGVWHPGDSIYLTFMLADTKRTLPKNHPISFEFEDPQGRIAETRTITEETGGFYAITTSTRESAPTGDWTARVRLGGAVFTKRIKIETIMPNRLKMNLAFRGAEGAKKGQPLAVLDADKTQASLAAEWLHGAPAPALKADVSVSFADTGTAFAAYGDYSFRDAARSVDSARQTIFEGKLDGAGKANFDIQLNPGRNVPGKLSARLLTRVFEPSGVFSSEQATMEFSPYERYVGLKLPAGDAARGMLLTDTAHKANVVVLDAAGTPVSGGVELEAAVYKMNWRWWWEKGRDEAADWANALSRTPVLREKVSAAAGKAQFDFLIKNADWGRYLVVVEDKEGGHAAASVCYIDWPDGAGRSTETGGAAFSLNLATSKSEYRAGETVAVSFPSNSTSEAFVVLEKGGEIIKKEWIHCAGGTTRYEFKAEAAMTPNIYAHITLFQPHLQTVNDLPIRLYGIVPVRIHDPSTVLKPEIRAAAVWEPQSRASFTVREASGRAMTYTAVVVDEGLLGITRFTTPDPHTAFYRKEASFLKSWDVFSEVMSAYSGKLETLLAIGGGDDGVEDGERPKRFKPVVRYFSPRRLAAGASETLSFDMPEYTGAVRIMVIAASSESAVSAYGSAESSVQVKSDLMVLATAPRVLSPNDEASIPVTVFSYKEGKRSVRVTLSVEGQIALSSGANIDVDFDGAGEKTIEFKTKAQAVGAAALLVRAASTGLKPAAQNIALEVRSTALPVTLSKSRLVAAGESWNESFDLPGRGGTNSAVLEFSRLPPLGLENRLSYLIAYPHGCIEQTTSAVFPQLYLERVMPLDAAKLRAARENIAAGIDRIAGFQTFNGGFSYWAGEGDANEWGTNYAGHFLAAARDAGFAVNETLIAKWIDFQRSKAAAWSGTGKDGDALTQAYRLYTLAFAGKADLGSMNRLRERANLPEPALWRLAAAYWYAGQRDAARVMTASLAQSSRAARELDGTFGSELRDKAMILEALAIMNQLDRAKGLLNEVAGALSQGAWLSTQETAYALIAIMPFAGSNRGEPLSAEWNFGGAPQAQSSDAAIIQTERRALAGVKADIAVKNTSGSPLYAQITLRGTPEEGGEKSMSAGLSLDVKYYIDGKEGDPAKAAMGENIEVRTTLTNTSPLDVKNIALVHPLPASWEIVNTRIGGGETKTAGLTYQDIRGDRINSYLDVTRGGDAVISFLVTRTYNGAYFMPSVQAYAMYDESIRAVVPGRR